jgi:hypothetical protein
MVLEVYSAQATRRVLPRYFHGLADSRLTAQAVCTSPSSPSVQDVSSLGRHRVRLGEPIAGRVAQQFPTGVTPSFTLPVPEAR